MHNLSNNINMTTTAPRGITHIKELCELKEMCPNMMENTLKLIEDDSWFVEHLDRFLPVAILHPGSKKTQTFIHALLEYPDNEKTEKTLFRLIGFDGRFFIDSTEYLGGSFSYGSALMEESLTLIHEIDEF
jgi:hypothetical protein